MTTRRNLLTMLGLTTVASAAIGADDVTNQRETLPYGKSGNHLQTTKYDPERMATALEKLAAEIRSHSVNVVKFRVEADAVSTKKDEHWLEQQIIIGLEFLIDPPAA